MQHGFHVVHAEVEFVNGSKREFLHVRDIVQIVDGDKKPVALNISFQHGNHFTSLPFSAVKNVRLLPSGAQMKVKYQDHITGAVIEHG